MAGGRGERFWPQSRQATPKHLLSIVGDQPMLTQTVARVTGVVPRENIFVLTTQCPARRLPLHACPDLLPPPTSSPSFHGSRHREAATGLAMLLVKQRRSRDRGVRHAAGRPCHPRHGGICEAPQGGLRVRRGGRRARDHRHQAHGARDRFRLHPADRLVEGNLRPSRDGREALRGEAQPRDGELILAVANISGNAGMFVWRVPVVEAAFQDALARASTPGWPSSRRRRNPPAA